jgi:hypothetical protein
MRVLVGSSFCRGAAAPQQRRRSCDLDLPPTTLAGGKVDYDIVLSNGTVGRSPNCKYILGHARSTVFRRLAFARRLCSRLGEHGSRVTTSERGWVGARIALSSPLVAGRGARGEADPTMADDLLITLTQEPGKQTGCWCYSYCWSDEHTSQTCTTRTTRLEIVTRSPSSSLR